MSKHYLLGNEAIARGLLECGVDVATGYPGTPSSEILTALAQYAKENKFHIEWSVNEKVALEVAIGAAWTGARSVCTMKHVGLNVAADPFMTLSHTGVVGGLVLISADDPFCHSSQNEQDSRMYAKFAKIPCFDPQSPGEAKDMLAYAYEFSEKFQTPVMLRPTTRVSHAKSDVDVYELQSRDRAYEFKKDIERFVVLPKHTRVLLKKLNEKQKAMSKELASSPWNKLSLKEGAKLGIISSGVASVYVEEVLDGIGIPVSYLKIGAYPVDDSLIRELVTSVEKVLVIEELMPLVEEQVRMYAPFEKVSGKLNGAVPHEGEFDVTLVSGIIKKALGLPVQKPADVNVDIEIPQRPPALCPGCPHRSTFYIMKSVFKDESIFASDIGCYTLGTQLGAVDTCLCMGASITIASGLSHSGIKNKVACTIGDSTFLHTGIQGLINAVYNKANITVVILDNRTTAMTGHQPHPGTGATILGDPVTEVSLEALVKSCGVELLQVVDPFDPETTKAAFKKAYQTDGVNVIIARQPCIITAKKMGIKRKPMEVIEDLCEGCRRCVKFGCPAIEFENGKAKITDACAGCGVCTKICQFGAIKIRSD
ncbi:indolepyruvate ferredoxin oxidoreductase subunit alpha [Methanocella sp. CWC-04]|uniref:Indolepyruvate oxidoreductase subunit IorA n=1 Tax=Methanooceanicella nereidis TaxID=2052831 RepID=A0AAP2RFH8_9EURY|nr:indolepyruvate ferredoxin oxidoreductase subunit alpha [Methanocella sp. CWC-04]MCD1295640.1 indolepyruvate ferredoxin oxidoreductase subunit alpha [Methanocella sp. CWC-04]